MVTQDSTDLCLKVIWLALGGRFLKYSDSLVKRDFILVRHILCGKKLYSHKK